jgi:holin-like protein
MSKSLNIIWQYLRAFVLIYACLYAGIFLASLLPITIPGSIIGMLILFVLLALQILPAKWVNPGCFVLIRYMALLFVPIGVGVMQYFDLLKAQFGPLWSPVRSARWWFSWSSAGVRIWFMANVKWLGRKQKNDGQYLVVAAVNADGLFRRA